MPDLRGLLSAPIVWYKIQRDKNTSTLSELLESILGKKKDKVSLILYIYFPFRAHQFI